MISSGLAYVAIGVRDVAAVAATLEQDFRLPRADYTVDEGGTRVPVFPVGESALALFEAGDPFVGGEEKPGIHHITLATTDLEAATREAAAVGVPATGAGPKSGLGGARRTMLSPETTAGVRTYLCEPLALESTPGGWVERIDHIGVASGDNAIAIDAFSRRLGFTIESTQTDMEVETRIESFTSDKYGVRYHSHTPRPVAGLRVAFITVGDCELEFLQDLDPQQVGQVDHGRSGTTRQDQGAISRFIGSRGPGLHHIALKVTDIDGTLAALTRKGHAMIDTAGRPGSRRAQIGFIHPRSLGGLLVHLVQRDQV